jgi:MSHA biogenesis protein MshG
VGEESGALDDMMEEVAEMYQSEVEYELKTLAQQIEPILIVSLGIMVLILALGIFLPMWDLGKVALKRWMAQSLPTQPTSVPRMVVWR